MLKTFICIKRYRLCNNNIIGTIEGGGLNFPDIESVLDSLKAAWISRLLDPDKPCFCLNIANYWYNKTGFDTRTIVKCNFRTLKDFPVIKKIPVFYQDIILAYNKCKTIKPILECNPYEIVTDVIWGNIRYRFKGECLYNKSWINSGFVFIKDILDVNGRIMQAEDIVKRLQNRSNWIADYCMIKKACKVVEGLSSKLEYANVKISDRVVIYAKNKNWDVLYQKLGFYYKTLRDQNYKVPYMQKVWCKQLDVECLNFQSSWNSIYNIKIRQMPIIKLAEFNYKILSGTLPCGYMLSKWKADIPSVCIVCDVKENIKHMLFDCSKVKKSGNKLVILCM